MFKTVEDVIQLKAFENIKVVAGEEGLSHVVTGATLMEVPDILPYLEENTLLITTLFPIASSPKEMEQLIPQLCSEKVAGICIKPLRYIEKIPQIMLDQANQLGFPIIELPVNANLSTLINQILEMSLNEHMTQLQFRDNVHQNMIEHLLSGTGVEKLVEKLAQLLNKNIFLLDKELSGICAAIKDESMENWQIVDKLADESLENQKMFENEHILYPIKAGENLFGYIFVPDTSKTNEKIIIAIEQAAMLFALVFLKNYAVAINQRNFKDVFIRELLQGEVRSEIEFENKIKVFNLPLVFPQYVVSIKLFTENEVIKKQFYNELIDYNFVSKKLSFLNNKFIVYFNDALIILDKSENDQKIYDLYTKIIVKLEQRVGMRIKIGIGISKASKRFDTLDIAYKQAINMVNIGNIIYPNSFVALYSQNRIFELIEQIPDTSLLVNFVRDKLGELIDYDKENGTDFLETLQVLMRLNFNLKKASEYTYVHYNTMRYRANKIRQLGIDLEPGQNQGEIVFAYNIYLWLKAINKI
ncbi:Purine catabolism regulatory protein [Sporomusa rhizae]|uniref:PucR family transcriptional regulator n=1 Tax=Sporomusa rhizae TaxID=357999 RepID=UPI00352B63EA